MSTVQTRLAQAKLAGLLRTDAENAARPSGRIRKEDDAMLGPYLQEEAAALRKKKGLTLRVDALVDRAMKDAMATWKHFNQRGPTTLSQAELAAISAQKPNLGVLSTRAAELVREETPILDPARIPNVSLDANVPGIALSHVGDVFSITVANTVPQGSAFSLNVEGTVIALKTMPGGVNLYALGLPEGYGSETLAGKKSATETVSRARIQRDLPGTLSSGEALTKARAALIEYTKTKRVKDSDWKDMIGMSWDEAVAHGVLDDIAKFAAPSADGSSGIERRPDRYELVGAGPLGLYTEASVRKKDGKILRLYVEID